MEPGVIRLKEYDTRPFPTEALEPGTVSLLRRDYAQQVAVAPTWSPDGYQWALTAQGWVGQIPVTPDLRLILEPKVPLLNLFQMLEYAYRLARFEHGLVSANTLEEVYQHLAVVLAKRVLERARQGLYRVYVAREERTPFVRGRLNMCRMAREPWEARIDCQYQDHTADVEDNRILAWTLYGILRTGICDEEGQSVVRQAYRQVQHHTSLEPVNASACENRSYHRLNDDYRQLHGLCHFFLDGSGPTHRYGEHTMVPFLVDMAALFERFVAEWLAISNHMPCGFHVTSHYPQKLNQSGTLAFDIDLVVQDDETNTPICVMDTKYKTGEVNSDIHQILAYAQSVGCRHGFLVYPAPLGTPIHGYANDIDFHSLTFDLSGNLDAAGEQMVEQLALWCPEVQNALCAQQTRG